MRHAVATSSYLSSPPHPDSLLCFDLTTSTTTSLFSRPNLATSVFQAHLRYLKHQSYEHLFTYRFTLSNHNAVLTYSPRRRCYSSCSDCSIFVSTTTSIEAPFRLKQRLTFSQPPSLRSMFTSMSRRVRVFEHLLTNMF